MHRFIVSEELSSMEIFPGDWNKNQLGRFQKNLVVWKFVLFSILSSFFLVSEELSSMEIRIVLQLYSGSGSDVSEELSSMEMESC